MKAAFISDVHIGPSGYHNGIRRKLTEHSESFVREFVRHASEAGDYSFAIHMGDLIQDDERETDLANFQRGLKLFSDCAIPIHHLVGNHDTIHMSPAEVQVFLGYKNLHYSFDVEDVHIVILYSHVPVPKVPRIILPADQLNWLSADLASTKKPTIVFAHHSFADQDLTGNPWFEARPEDCLVENREEVRKIISDSRKVVAVVNGHLHWNRVDIHDRIPYITVQSAIENFANDGIPANAWGEIELVGDAFRISIFGNDPKEFKYNFVRRNG